MQTDIETDDLIHVAEELEVAIRNRNPDRALLLVGHLNEEASERLFEALDDQELTWLLHVIGVEKFANLLSEIEEEVAADVLELISVPNAADLLEEIDPDDATDIFNEIEDRFGDAILVEMEPEEAEEIVDLLAYPPDTAGGIMTPAFVSIDPALTADQAISALRKASEDSETFNYVYVTDIDDHLLGVLSLHRLVLTGPATPVRQLIFEDTIRVPVLADQEVAARLLIDNDLLAIPVVDDENHILGIITVDDIAEVLEEEATEDIERLGGSAPLQEPYLLASPRVLFRKRFVWLLVLFFAQFATVSIISNYENVVAQVTVLSFFIPILIGTGGNIGSQTVSTLIRALAIGEVTPRNAFRVLSKEAATGVALGIAMAILMFLRAYFTGGSTTEIAITVSIAVFAVSVWAATVGAILPLALTKLKVDPAVVSAPLISSLVDAAGLFIYFSLATAILEIQ